MQSSEIMNIPMIDNAKVMSKGQMKKVSHTINIKVKQRNNNLYTKKQQKQKNGGKKHVQF